MAAPTLPSLRDGPLPLPGESELASKQNARRGWTGRAQFWRRDSSTERRRR
jgi:hypothetical protein